MTDSKQTASGLLRPEIQALRALAVLLVLLFHFWPHRIPGGYVGVDVFFAISGFLITAHLVREVEKNGSVRLRTFWARRIRRLLPASLLVLVATAGAVFIWVPQLYWPQILREIAAATVYVENWQLAHDAVDYLAAENVRSPVQHYWSLSVEEQFYLVWPLLIVLAVLVARRVRRTDPIGAIRVTLGLILVASFAYSVYETSANSAAAYFVTPTRAWEFGAGAMLATLPGLGRSASDSTRAAVSWLGLLLIGVAAFVLHSGTPFPGYAAALPVVGTLAAIWAGAPSPRWSPLRPMASTPVQKLGDWSYSIYLWHWPPIVIFELATGDKMTWPVKLVVIAGVVVLAALTKRLVEDPVRFGLFSGGRRLWPQYAAAAMSMVLVLSVVVAGNQLLEQSSQANKSRLEQLMAMGTPCLGANAMVEAQRCEDGALGQELFPEMSMLTKDTGSAYGCYDQEPGATLTSCRVGSQRSDATRVALVGDSHAAMLIPAIEGQLNSRNWAVDTYVARGCIWAKVDAADQSDSCYARRHAMMERLGGGPKYDFVIVTGKRNMSVNPQAAAGQIRRYVEAWRPVLERGTRIVVVVDNPALGATDLGCLVDDTANGGNPTRCAVDRKGALGTRDALEEAAKRTDGKVQMVDLTDLFCTETQCPLVIGNVIVYRDAHHMTATYARTLGPHLVERVAARLAP
ncbi:acyltransferase [Micromonospora ureilytica]|uniref:acyltransferase family protein n=1 Tax=Micromonospora ureilytica TaxID=709868 RepID=UPI002E117287|nr:acyltransferase [Micromonospora ureilytica]